MTNSDRAKRRSRWGSPRAALACLGALAAAAACVESPRRPGSLAQTPSSIETTHFEPQIDRLSHDLNIVGAYLDEWGSLSISGPIADVSGEDFRFSLEISDNALYEANRLEGRSRSAQLTAFMLSLAGEAKVGRLADLTEDAASPSAPAGGQTGTPDSDGSGAKSGETAKDGEDEETAVLDGVDVSARETNRALDAVGPLSEVLALASGEMDMSQRRRIRLTASDRAELGLHEFLLNATERNITNDYKIVYLPFTVSCQPGWRTRRDFAGRIDVELRYDDGQRETSTDRHPLIVGVYPAFDSQELNLRQSARNLRALSASFKAIGLTAGGDALAELAKRTESDSETLTGLTTLTSYSNGGNRIGFEFQPTFQALAEPGDEDSEPGLVLRSTTIPALAIVAVHKSDYQWLQRRTSIAAVLESLQTPETRAAFIRNLGWTTPDAGGLDPLASLGASGAQAFEFADKVIQTVVANRIRIEEMTGRLTYLEQPVGELGQILESILLDQRDHWATPILERDEVIDYDTNPQRIRVDGIEARLSDLTSTIARELLVAANRQRSLQSALRLSATQTWRPIEPPRLLRPTPAARAPLPNNWESDRGAMAGLVVRVEQEAKGLREQVDVLGPV
jgi:hypothetical protein